MAAALEPARERVARLVYDVWNANSDALGNGLKTDYKTEVVASLKRARNERELRLLLADLHQRLLSRRVSQPASIRADWMQRCQTEPSNETTIALCEELDEAICWDPEVAPWRQASAAAAPSPEIIELPDDDAPDAPDADEDPGLKDAINQSLEHRNAELERRNAELERRNAELERRNAELVKTAKIIQAALRRSRRTPQPSGASGDAIDLRTDSEAEEDDAVVAVTSPNLGVRRVKVEASEAAPARGDSGGDVDGDSGVALERFAASPLPAHAAAAGPSLSPYTSGAGPSTLAPRGAQKREAEPPEPPRPAKQPRKLYAPELYAPEDAVKGHGLLSGLLRALLRCSGQLRQARKSKSKQLHLLGEKSGVSCLHAAAFKDANAGVLALILSHAAADSAEALQYVLRRQCGAGTAKTGFARFSDHIVLGAGATALDFACVHGAVECAELLLRAGADPNARTVRLHGAPQDGRMCALDLAASAGHLGIIRVLLRARARVNARNGYGWTPLHWAAEHAQVNAVRLLLLSGADPDAVDEDGRTAMVWALASDNGKPPDASEELKTDCHDDRVAIVVELAYAGARLGFPARADEPITTGDYGRSLLHACAGGLTTASLDLLRRLLLAPVSPPLNLDIGAGELGTPLDLAIHAGWAEGALLMLNKGASVNAVEKTKFTPLMRAASLPAGIGGSDLIRLCCMKHAQVEACDEGGLTAAHWAAKLGRVDALRTLRAMGADLRARDHTGMTPATLAQRHHAADAKLKAAIAAVIDAPACPPRTYQPGEDAACDQEDVAIAVDATALSDDICFIAHNVEAPGMTLSKPHHSMDVSAACCDCILCIPGLCRCLSSSGVVNVPAELERVDKLLEGEIWHELSKGEDSGGSRAWRAVGTGIRNLESQPMAAFATGAAQASSTHPKAPAGLHATGLAVALLALRRLLPLIDESMLDSGWGKRVRGAAKSPAFVDDLCTLLLELDDAAAQVVSADAQSRSVPVWRAKQAAAWLAEARPAWRAGARQGRKGAPLTPAALGAAMRSLLTALLSVHTPLLVKPTYNSCGFASLNLCSPRCPCAGGGCRATGVQFPLELRSAGEGGIGMGVFSQTTIPRGALVAPYVGEVTSAAKADAQFRESAGQHFYQLDLESDAWARLRTAEGAAVVDGTHFGNTVRYLNHSCAPNMARVAVDWPGLDAGPLVFLCASEDVEPGTELCWDYFSGDRRDMGFTCACPKCAPRPLMGPRARGKQPMRY